MAYKLAAMVASVAFIGTLSQASALTLDFGTLGIDGTSFTANKSLTVDAPGDQRITFTAVGSQFQLYTQGANLANNQFANGTHILSAGLTDSPITLSFSRPLESLSLTSSSLRFGPYTATFDLFDGTTLLSSTSIASDVEPTVSGALPFIDLSGFGATRQRITSAVISIDQPLNFFGGSVLLGPVSYTVSAVPLPSSAPLFGVALLGLGAAGYGVKRTRKAATTP